jgi:CTP-dependent riboflavin kinase
MQVIRDGGYMPTEIISYRNSFADEKARLEADGYVIEGIGEGRLAITRKYRERDG